MNAKLVIVFLFGLICGQLLVGITRAEGKEVWGRFEVNKVILLLERIEQNTRK